MVLESSKAHVCGNLRYMEMMEPVDFLDFVGDGGTREVAQVGGTPYGALWLGDNFLLEG